MLNGLPLNSNGIAYSRGVRIRATEIKRRGYGNIARCVGLSVENCRVGCLTDGVEREMKKVMTLGHDFLMK